MPRNALDGRGHQAKSQKGSHPITARGWQDCRLTVLDVKTGAILLTVKNLSRCRKCEEKVW